MCSPKKVNGDKIQSVCRETASPVIGEEDENGGVCVQLGKARGGSYLVTTIISVK